MTLFFRFREDNKFRLLGAWWLAALLMLSVSTLAEVPLQAGPHPDADLAANHGGDREHPGAHGALGFPHHTLGVFLGDTTETRRNQGFTLGLEYEYRLSETFGVGAIVEHVGGDFDTNVAVLPLAYHRGPWKLYAGPGIEDSEEAGGEFLVRVGLEYGFHVGNYELSPQIDVDFVDNEHLFIFGITVGGLFERDSGCCLCGFRRERHGPQADSVSALIFGAVQGSVCVSDQRLRRAVLRNNRNADTDSYLSG